MESEDSDASMAGEEEDDEDWSYPDWLMVPDESDLDSMLFDWADGLRETGVGKHAYQEGLVRLYENTEWVTHAIEVMPCTEVSWLSGLCPCTVSLLRPKGPVAEIAQLGWSCNANFIHGAAWFQLHHMFPNAALKIQIGLWMSTATNSFL